MALSLHIFLLRRHGSDALTRTIQKVDTVDVTDMVEVTVANTTSVTGVDGT